MSTNRVNLKSLIEALGQERFDSVFSGAMPAIRVMSVSGVRAGIRRGVSPDGTPFLPLKHNRPEGAGRPLHDKGLLAASVSATSKGRQVTLATNNPGAALHQWGGTITAKTGKYLAIPISKEAKRVGSPRKNHFPRKLFFLATQSAGGLLAEGDGKDGIIAHYVLKEKVVIPPRPFLGWSDQTLDRIERTIGDRAVSALAKLFGDKQA